MNRRSRAQVQEPPTTLLSDASLFLDFDGTLVELASTPDSVSLSDDVRSLLRQLQIRLSGRLALLSGRSMADVRSYLRPLDVAVAGSHGLELAQASEDIAALEAPTGLRDAILQLKQLESVQPGVLIEAKPGGAAIHYRQAPAAEAVCRETAARIANDIGMVLQHGKMVVELKHPSANKGQALKQFMSAPPFAGTRPVFIGDDLTDEDGFAAARELGGAGILVGPERPTLATFRIEDVGSVEAWLVAASEALP
jgi:trehalose 6-phosphate phosphatase